MKAFYLFLNDYLSLQFSMFIAKYVEYHLILLNACWFENYF